MKVTFGPTKQNSDQTHLEKILYEVTSQENRIIPYKPQISREIFSFLSDILSKPTFRIFTFVFRYHVTFVFFY